MEKTPGITPFDCFVIGSRYEIDSIFEEVNDARRTINLRQEITWDEVFDRIGCLHPKLMADVIRNSHEWESEFKGLCVGAKLTRAELTMLLMRFDEWRGLCFQMFHLIAGLKA